MYSTVNVRLQNILVCGDFFLLSAFKKSDSLIFTTIVEAHHQNMCVSNFIYLQKKSGVATCD